MTTRNSSYWKRPLQLGALFGVALLAPLAQAQMAPSIAGRPGEEHIRSNVGVSIQGGGGVNDFTSSGSRAATNVGGSWDIRVVAGTRRILALEGAYVGSSRSLSTGPLSEDTTLFSNGLEGVVRLNAPLLAGETLIEPFAFVGAGWSYYSLSNIGSNFIVVSDTDAVGTIPMGAGLAFGYRGFIAEARFTYRSVYDDDQIVLANVGDPALGLDNWNAGLMIGFEF
jgi:hypothetical protein